ncbi:MAG TPA: hypothetical protein VHW70_13510 [Edaphobacter sp.]|nr:hypothetical protein [Edaphobacter sp.]
MRWILVVGLMIGLGGAAAAVAETAGSCSIRAGRMDGKMSFGWEGVECAAGHHCHEGDSDMLWSKWSGVTPQDLEHEGAAVDARMKAEAGEMRCVGTVHEAALRGTYSFTPDGGFAKRMEAMGFDDQTPERLQGYAMLDVTTEWVKEMKDAGVTEMSAQNLMGLRALKVDAGYVKGMAAAGYPELRASQLTSMKAVGVNPEKVQAVKAMGFSPTQQELIQMSVFKIDAPFVERMKARGFKNLTIAQLVKIKVFKLDE